MNIIMFPLLLIINVGSVQCALRVIGGRDANEDEYLYVVRMEIHDRLAVQNMLVVVPIHICTAAMLAPTWALTAGHCIVDNLDYVIANSTETGRRVVIHPGSIKHPSWMDTIYEVTAAIRHPGYKNRLNANIVNDVGLLQTQRILLPEFAKLSAVDFNSLHGHEATLVGFGGTNSSSGKLVSTLELMKPLQVLNVIVISCSGLRFTMVPKLCVARRCGQSASLCQGDSGGPAIHSSGIVAVNSLAAVRDCRVKKDRDRTNIVAVLTPISPYIGWISQHIREANFQQSF